MEIRQPKFRLYRGKELLLAPTDEAKRYTAAASQISSPQDVILDAKMSCIAAGVDPKIPENLQRFTKLQFGKYRGKTLHWLLENDVGWAVRLITSHEVSID